VEETAGVEEAFQGRKLSGDLGGGNDSKPALIAECLRDNMLVFFGLERAGGIDWPPAGAEHI
jgi:hypothetical protein